MMPCMEALSTLAGVYSLYCLEFVFSEVGFWWVLC
jgi:hypothetical protein